MGVTHAAMREFCPAGGANIFAWKDQVRRRQMVDAIGSLAQHLLGRSQGNHANPLKRPQKNQLIMAKREGSPRALRDMKNKEKAIWEVFIPASSSTCPGNDHLWRRAA
jgi:hypothetical protein